MLIKIATDFSDKPGVRYRKNGEHTGQEFREDILEPAFNNNEQITIDFDGCYGFPASFLEEAFGGLVRNHPEFKKEQILARFVFVCNDNPIVLERVRNYILSA